MGRTGIQCPGAPTFTSLQVVREGYAPLQKTITDTDAIARLYNAAQRLPRLDPNGVYNCNAGPPVVYHLAFMRGGGVVARMDLYPNGDFKGMGCAYVILVPNDRRAMTLDFDALAERTLNVPVFAPTAGGSYSPWLAAATAEARPPKTSGRGCGMRAPYAPHPLLTSLRDAYAG